MADGLGMSPSIQEVKKQHEAYTIPGKTIGYCTRIILTTIYNCYIFYI